VTPSDELGAGELRLLRFGRCAWAVLGIVGVAVLAWLLAGRLAVVVVPLVLALFPAALLAPAVGWLHRHRVPRAAATAIVVLVAVAVVGGVFALVLPAFVAQVPELTRSLTAAGSELDVLIHRVPSVEDDATVGALIRRGILAFLGGLNAALLAVLNLALGLLLVVVLLVCYLSGGARIVRTATGLVPHRGRPAVRELLGRVWDTLGSYTRTLFLVALVDATLVGVGLWLLGVPLVLPLSVLVFFGAFIPYVGAFASGLLAVLVALADGGVSTAAAVLVLILVVQQIEGNVVQPLLMGKAVRLSAFTVIVSVGIGATLLGVLGAFLAVPTAACVARAATFLRERQRPDADGPAATAPAPTPPSGPAGGTPSPR
jgi:putative heme transporter